MADHEMYRENYSAAIPWLDKLDADQIQWKLFGYALAQIYSSNYDNSSLRLNRLNPYYRSIISIIQLGKKGETKRAQKELEQFIDFNRADPSFKDYAVTEYSHYWWVADLYSTLGDKTKAFEYLDKAYCQSWVPKENWHRLSIPCLSR